MPGNFQTTEGENYGIIIIDLINNLHDVIMHE